MTTLSRLNKIRSQLKAIEALVEGAIASEKATAQPLKGRPDPHYTQRLACSIVEHCWDWMEARDEFTAKRVHNKLSKHDSYSSGRSLSSVSAILSHWADEGYLRIKTAGSGRRATVYEVREPAAVKGKTDEQHAQN